MSVPEISQLHGRYVRLSDRFKTLWTYHQLASGVYKNLIDLPLPYNIDFQRVYEPIRKVADVIQSAAAATAAEMMDRSDRELQNVTRQLLGADDELSPSLIRRFFEKTRAQDEKIIFQLIKFYLYADAVEGRCRDKLDFLFTRIAQEYVEERGEYSARDSLELRRQFQSLLNARPRNFGSQEEMINVIRSIRTLKEEIERCGGFDVLMDQKLFERARKLKHEVGDLYFHPDVLLAIVQCNVAAKNTFSRLYAEEEGRIVEDARRLLENEHAIARGFGESNPELLDELDRFKRFMKEFDDARAESNVKHDVIAQLKQSMANILTQLDRNAGPPEEFPEVIFEDAERQDRVERVFGKDALLTPWLIRILAALEEFDESFSHEQIIHSPEVFDLRLEPWEIDASMRLFRGEGGDGEPEDVNLLYLRATALRMRIDEEARELVALPAQSEPEIELLEQVKASLERAKELDAAFRELLQEGLSYSHPGTVRRLYRSRLRLLRGFSGLWLIYDQHTSVRTR